MKYRYSVGEDGKFNKKAAIYTNDEHGINPSDVDIEAVSIIRKLNSAGYETYIVGGAVRDLVLGKKPKDFDIVSAASPAKIKKIFRNSRVIGRRFRLVHIFFGLGQGNNSGYRKIFEVSTFRSLKDGHTSNTFGTIEEDVQRRDFTMNALYYDPIQQIVVDYIDGMNDIKKRQVKPVIPLLDIFTDDPVRMIRAVKYAAVTGFSLPLNLKRQIKKESNLLSSISPSRLTEEIFKIIYSGRAAAIIELLDKMGLYCYLQPNAAKLMRNPDFKERYLKSMALLTEKEKYRGQAIGALFFDYLNDLQNWEPGTIIENYREIFKTVRSFVLPMNPPRFEMEYALRKFFSSRKIIVKRTQITPAKQEDSETPTTVKKRKRRRKKKKKTTEQKPIIQ
jgi:poly(A) polymerase